MLDPANLPFTLALGAMLVLAVLQIVGVGDLFDADADFDSGIKPVSEFLGDIIVSRD